ncbi:MAG: ribosomal RNA small subunit methyltransferase A [Actinobacteria bacterium]|nr:ribosomal RNA small subunit methyltransferase A [Actinomycetota bacterium]
MSQYISSPSKTAEILKEYDIRLKKTLGQNFIIDTNILKKIVRLSGIGKGETILEIGSGIGSLTEILLGSAEKVVCVELDSRLSDVFETTLQYYVPERAILIKDDAMKLDYAHLAEKYNIKKIVSNLPYKIAAPLILKILFNAPIISKMYLTIQKDIADRLLASKGDKNYNAFSVKAGFLADFKVLFSVQKASFIPVPHVDSVFIEVASKSGGNEAGKFKKSYNGGFSEGKIKEFFEFIDACFLHRRKKMLNSLEKSSLEYIKGKTENIIEYLEKSGKNKNIRAEELSIYEFLELFLLFE